MPIFPRFGADFFTVYADFSRFVRDINGEKNTSRYRCAFSRLVFHGLAPLEDFRARKGHINFEHINFLKVGTTLGQPAG